jgi:prefoldin subunit 5
MTDRELQKRFTGIDSQFERVDKRFEKIDERFAQVDERFTQVDARFDRIERQLDKLTIAMLNGFDRIEKALETKASKQDLDTVRNTLDAFLKRQETDEQERLVTGHQITRLNTWAGVVGKHTGIEFTQ